MTKPKWIAALFAAVTVVTGASTAVATWPTPQDNNPRTETANNAHPCGVTLDVATIQAREYRRRMTGNAC